jgi:glycosyltransferase involved in cell wall biosynthesis
MKKINLVTINDMEFPLKEGLRKEVWMQAKALKEKGYDVNVLCKGGKKQKIDGITIIPKNLSKIGFIKSDIIHFFGAPCPELYLILKFAKFKKIYLTIFDGELCKFWESKYSLKSVKLINKYVNKIFIQTNYQFSIAKQFFKEEKLEILPPLIPYLKVKNIKSKNPRILFMSHFSEFKGILDVLKIFDLVYKFDNTCELVLSNSSSFNDKSKEEIIKKINSYRFKYPNNIIIKNKISPSDELSKSWFYLYPFKEAHKTFSLPLSLYEADMCKTIFFAPDLGGLSEIFNKHNLINPKNIVQETSKKIISLIKKIKKSKLKFNNLKQLKNCPNNQKIIKNILSYYDKKETGFIYSNPKPHYVHKAFADSVNSNYIDSMLYKKKSFLFPFCTLIAFIKQYKLIKRQDNFLLVGGQGLFLGKFIKLIFKEKKVILLNADPLFYQINKKPNSIRSKLLIYLTKNLDGIICNSNLNLSYAKKYYKKKILVVYPFVREEFLDLAKNKKHKVNFIYIGRDHKEKNIKLLIKIAKKMNKKLYLVGNFDKNKKYPKNVILTGFKKSKEIINLGQKCKFGFLLSKYDSFGLTPLEFILMDIIPIISEKCGVKEVIKCQDLIIKEKLSCKKVINEIKNLNQKNRDDFLNKLKSNLLKKELTLKNQCAKFKKEFNKLTK